MKSENEIRAKMIEYKVQNFKGKDGAERDIAGCCYDALAWVLAPSVAAPAQTEVCECEHELVDHYAGTSSCKLRNCKCTSFTPKVESAIERKQYPPKDEVEPDRSCESCRWNNHGICTREGNESCIPDNGFKLWQPKPKAEHKEYKLVDRDGMPVPFAMSAAIADIHARLVKLETKGAK